MAKAEQSHIDGLMEGVPGAEDAPQAEPEAAPEQAAEPEPEAQESEPEPPQAAAEPEGEEGEEEPEEKPRGRSEVEALRHQLVKARARIRELRSQSPQAGAGQQPVPGTHHAQPHRPESVPPVQSEPSAPPAEPPRPRIGFDEENNPRIDGLDEWQAYQEQRILERVGQALQPSPAQVQQRAMLDVRDRFVAENPTAHREAAERAEAAYGDFEALATMAIEEQGIDPRPLTPDQVMYFARQGAVFEKLAQLHPGPGARGLESLAYAGMNQSPYLTNEALRAFVAQPEAAEEEAEEPTDPPQPGPSATVSVAPAAKPSTLAKSGRRRGVDLKPEQELAKLVDELAADPFSADSAEKTRRMEELEARLAGRQLKPKDGLGLR